MTYVFISYSRKDSDFVRQLHGALQTQGRDVWVDWEDIPLTANWWQEICGAIDSSDSFAFVISPDSVNSQVCRDEINYAVENHKRFIPIFYRDIAGVDRGTVHSAIHSHNWIPFTSDQDFSGAVKRLLEALDADLDHARTHSRLLTRAREWDSKGRDAGYLLTGGEVREYRRWLQFGGEKEPKATQLQLDYVLTSQTAQNRRQVQLLAGALTAVLVAFGLIVLALLQRQQLAEVQADNIAFAATSQSQETRIAQQQTQAREDSQNLLSQVNLGLTQQILVTELADARATAAAANATLVALGFFSASDAGLEADDPEIVFTAEAGPVILATAYLAQPTPTLYTAATQAVSEEGTQEVPLDGTRGLWVDSAGDDANACDSPESPCLTITAAVAQAWPGATIHLGYGVYAERVVLTQDMTIVGPDRTLTYMDGESLGTVITVGEGATVTLRGFSITGGNSATNGGGIENRGALTLEDVTIIANYASENGGGIANFGTLTASNVDITNNYGQLGGGIYNAPGAVLNEVDETVHVESNIADDLQFADYYFADENAQE